jgi:hypothetical protein
MQNFSSVRIVPNPFRQSEPVPQRIVGAAVEHRKGDVLNIDIDEFRTKSTGKVRRQPKTGTTST